MNEQQAREAGKQAGIKPGEYITLQSEGQINNPHGPDNHVDGWHVRNDDGQYIARKIHSNG